MAENRVHPHIIMERVPAQIRAQITPDPRDSPFYKPFRDLPESIGEAAGGRLQKRTVRVIAEQVVMDNVGFDGDFTAFLEYLRTDPQFYFDNPDDLYREYLAVSKRLDPELVKLFGKLPRLPYGVRPIPEAIAPDTTTAYYQPPPADGSRAGYYYVNLHKPEVRPTYEIEVLSVHEAVPGHHLQIALAMELNDLPAFRRFARHTAFVEGWGLYAERLGYDMGLYQDPYSRFGQLTYDMWRAVPLDVLERQMTQWLEGQRHGATSGSG